MKDIPIYDISIDDAEELQGVSKISLVDMPAIGVNFIALRKESKPKGFIKKECLGCPPNGDGTRVNGEPDLRCKGDGSGQTKGGGKGKASAKPAAKAETKPETKSVGKTPPLEVPISVQSLAPIENWNEETKNYWSDPKNVQAVKDKQAELNQRKKDYSERVKAFNENLQGTRRITQSEKDAIAQERSAIMAEKASIDKEQQAQYRLNSVVKEIEDKVGSADRIKEIERIKEERRATEEKRQQEIKREAEAAKQKKEQERQKERQDRIDRRNSIDRSTVTDIQDEVKEKGFSVLSDNEADNISLFANYDENGNHKPEGSREFPVITNRHSNVYKNQYGQYATDVTHPGTHIFDGEKTGVREVGPIYWTTHDVGESIATINKDENGNRVLKPTEFGLKSGKFDQFMSKWRNSKPGGRRR